MNDLFLLAQEAPQSSAVTSLLEADKLIPVIAIVGGLTFAGVCVVLHYLYSWIELSQNNKIKLQMLEAGHTAEEIERVVCAGKQAEDDDEDSPKRPSRRAMRLPPAKQIPQHVA